jgi:hypothetical protein
MAEVVGKMALVALPNLQAELSKLWDEGKVNALLAKCPQCGGPMLAVLRRFRDDSEQGYCVPCKYPAGVVAVPAPWSPAAFLRLSKSIQAMYTEYAKSELEPLRFVGKLAAVVAAFEKDGGPTGRPRALDETVVDAIVIRLLGNVTRRSWTVKELIAEVRDFAYKRKLSPRTMGRVLEGNEETFAKAGFKLIRPGLTLVRAPASRRRP